MLPVLRLLSRGAQAGYAVLKLLPVRPKVILMTRQSRTTSTDFRLIAEEVRRRHPGHRVVILNHRKRSTLGYVPKVAKEIYHLATAQACIVDSYSIPVSILDHRPGLVIGQIWHALGAVKQFGYLSLGREEGRSPEMARAMRMHRGYSFISAAGSATAEIYARAFDAPSELIRPLGLPRVDHLLDADAARSARARIRQAHPRLDGGRRTIVYIPTFRAGEQLPYAELAAALDPDAATLVLKPHANDESVMPQGDGIIVDREFEVLDWLAIADAVITDYSAVAFEAALADVPLVFWAYDLEDYARTRGFALDYEREMPGPIVRTGARAMDAAVAAGTPDYRAFRARHLDYVTGTDGELPEAGRCAEAIVAALELR